MATSSIMEVVPYTHPHRRSTDIHLFRTLNQLNNLHPQRSHTTLITKRTTKEDTLRCHLLCTLICLATTNGKALLQHHNSDPWTSMRRLKISTTAMIQGTLQIKIAILPRPQTAILRLRNKFTAAMGPPRMVCSNHSHNIVILPHTCRNLRQTVNSSRLSSLPRRPLLSTRG